MSYDGLLKTHNSFNGYYGNYAYNVTLPIVITGNREFGGQYIGLG